MGDQPVVAKVSAGPVIADTFAGRIHVEWDNSAPVTPLGQMPFFIEFVKHDVSVGCGRALALRAHGDGTL